MITYGKLSSLQNEKLTHIFNHGIGTAADILNTMLSSPIKLSVPSLEFVMRKDIGDILGIHEGETLASVEMKYRGNIDGVVKLLFTSLSAGKLVSALTSEDFQDEDLDAIRSGTLLEVGNIVINAVMGTLSNRLRMRLSYTVPIFREDDSRVILEPDAEDSSGHVLLARAAFNIEKLETDGNIAVFFSMQSYRSLIEALDRVLKGEGQR